MSGAGSLVVVLVTKQTASRPTFYLRSRARRGGKIMQIRNVNEGGIDHPKDQSRAYRT